MQISVIIPCYNCEKTLLSTVESVRASGLGDYEIILVDDGSADGTAALCDALCEKYDQIRCIHQENAGVSAARNRGIDAARGEYIWFVDADDTVDPGAMEAAVHMAAEQQPDMLIFGLSFDYYHRGKLYRRDRLVPPCEGLISQTELLERFRAFYDCNAMTPVWNKLYRRSVLKDSGVRFRTELHLMEDFLFVLDTLPHCEKICCLPEAIYRYRQGDGWSTAYRRLKRISDLGEYVRPFEEQFKKLKLVESSSLADELYRMLLQQKLHLASLGEIRNVLAVHQSGAYARIPIEGGPLRIYLKNRVIRMRYLVGNWLKYRKSLYLEVNCVDFEKMTVY